MNDREFRQRIADTMERKRREPESELQRKPPTSDTRKVTPPKRKKA